MLVMREIKYSTVWRKSSKAFFSIITISISIPIFDFGCKVTKEKVKLNHSNSIWLKVAVRWLKMAVESTLNNHSQRKSFLSKHLLVKRVAAIPLLLHP